MCDFEAKLVAWLDHELPEDQAAEVESHVHRCQECRAECERYEQVSKTFDACCDAVVAAKTHSRMPRWIPVVSGALLAISATVLLLTFQRPRMEPLRPVVTPAATAATVSTAAPVRVLAPESAVRRTIRKRRPIVPLPARAAEWQPPETAVQITIPVETMFAPGAIPEGMNFVAELSIGPDGSVERLRLRP